MWRVPCFIKSYTQFAYKMTRSSQFFAVFNQSCRPLGGRDHEFSDLCSLSDTDVELQNLLNIISRTTGQFQPILAQSIISWREFNSVQIKGHKSQHLQRGRTVKCWKPQYFISKYHMIIKASIQSFDIASCMFYHIYSLFTMFTCIFNRFTRLMDHSLNMKFKSHLRFNLEFPPERDSGLLCPE